MVRKNGSAVEIFFPENSIAFLRVNWYFPHLQGQKNEIFSTWMGGRGGGGRVEGYRIYMEREYFSKTKYFFQKIP